jgi:hypothetical protein
MTIWAEALKIVYRVVFPISVHVVEFKNNGAIVSCLVKTALFAPIISFFEYVGFDKSGTTMNSARIEISGKPLLHLIGRFAFTRAIVSIRFRPLVADEAFLTSPCLVRLSITKLCGARVGTEFYPIVVFDEHFIALGTGCRTISAARDACVDRRILSRALVRAEFLSVFASNWLRAAITVIHSHILSQQQNIIANHRGRLERVVGFEPTKCEGGNLMPYHLAIPAELGAPRRSRIRISH